MKACIQAPAKINLHLEILDKRPDGYHNLISLFQSVSLFDTIEINIAGKGTGCTIKGDFPFPREENIVKKAVDAFFRERMQEYNLEINIQKRIPMGAGFGGGSSDAAGVIACLKRLFPDHLQEEKIRVILENLGSDVPYFYSAVAGLVTGRGEKIKSLCPRMDFHLVLIFPGFRIQTVSAYSWLDFRNTGSSMPEKYKEENLELVYNEDACGKWRFFNSFNEIVTEKYPVISTILSDVYSTGAFYGNITGSGSALFGLYREESQARAASGCLKNKYPFVFYAKPLDKIPLIVVL